MFTLFFQGLSKVLRHGWIQIPKGNSEKLYSTWATQGQMCGLKIVSIKTKVKQHTALLFSLGTFWILAHILEPLHYR